MYTDEYDRFSKEDHQMLLRTFNDHRREVRASMGGTREEFKGRRYHHRTVISKLVCKCDKDITHNDYSTACHTVGMLCISADHKKYSVYK